MPNCGGSGPGRRPSNISKRRLVGWARCLRGVSRMRKPAMRDVVERGNRSADVGVVTDSADSNNIGADSNNNSTDVNNSGADINNSDADINNSSADINNNGADINNSSADIKNSGTDNSTATGNVVCPNRSVDEHLPPRIRTPEGQLTHTSDSRLAQLRLQGVTRRTKPASELQSRGFVSHSNTNCSRIAGGSNGQ